MAAHRRPLERLALPWLASSPSAAVRRSRGRISGCPSYLGNGTFAASEESVVHARHLPAVQCASSFASRGGFARGDWANNCVD